MKLTFDVLDRVYNALSMLVWTLISDDPSCISRSSLCNRMRLSRRLLLNLMLILPLLRYDMLVLRLNFLPLLNLNPPDVFLWYGSRS